MKSKTICLLTSLLFTNIAFADPWADRVVEYIPGTEIGIDFVSEQPFNDSSVTLGEPTRYTSDAANFGSAVTPFGGPFRSTEIVSVGVGGSLTVAFDEPVTDDPRNPFGIDLLVFGNSFFGLDFGTGLATGAIFSGGGAISVSSDGDNFVPITNVEADGKFPTLGYRDTTEAFPAMPGNKPTDFTLPVDPAFDPAGLDIAGIVAGYARSGGGAGIDLATVGLNEISFVRFTNVGTAPFEIDALADVSPVPEPATLGWLVACGLWLVTKRRRG